MQEHSIVEAALEGTETFVLGRSRILRGVSTCSYDDAIMHVELPVVDLNDPLRC